MYKWLVPVGIVLFISAFFTATQPITPEMAFVSGLSVVLFAVPSYRAVIVQLGRKNGIRLLLSLGLYALILESSAINTGFPYGNFVYTDVLGTKIFGLTPWTVAFAYPPILLTAYWFVRKCGISRFWKTVIFTSVLAMVIDVVLDPAAVALGFWYWDTPGFYYGVPIINFVGWLFSGLIGTSILHYLWGHNKKPTPAVAYSGIAIIWFWTSINVFLGQWVPALIGSILIYVLLQKIKVKGTMKR